MLLVVTCYVMHLLLQTLLPNLQKLFKGHVAGNGSQWPPYVIGMELPCERDHETMIKLLMHSHPAISPTMEMVVKC
jgi:hypothetical protein